VAWSRYSREPSFKHATTRRTGVLLINLGTPDAPTPAALRKYLAQFLADPRVVEIPRPLWWLMLHGFILRTRPAASARRYASIWTDDGSPLRVHTEKQTALLQGLLGMRGRKDLLIRHAMRYGEPSIAQVIATMKAEACDRLLVLPLYPQYAASTTASALDEVFRLLSNMRNQPELRVVRHFPDHPGYIAALAKNINRQWTQIGRPDKLLLSFHGVPRFTLDRGDPYHCECQKTGRLLAAALGLTPDRVQVTFQSRFGRAQWLQPYTVEALDALARAGVRRVDVACPGFVADCLETLEEIAQEAKSRFLAAGGKEFNYLPCLNEADDWIAALADLAETGLAGWAELDCRQAADARAALASAMGAPR
jgi:ferrochelatase